MKKIIVSLSLMLLIIASMVGSVLAASGKITLEANNTQLNKNAQVTIDVKLSDIITTKGAGAFSTTLEYDKTSLKLEKMEGQNGWSTTPTYNEANGKLAMTKGSNITGRETILKLTFTVREAAKTNLVVTLKNTTFSESIEDIEIPNSDIRLTVKNGTGNSGNNTGNGNQTSSGDGSGSLNIISGSNEIDSTNDIASGRLPQTGVNNVIVPVAIGLAVVIAAVAAVRLRMMR